MNFEEWIEIYAEGGISKLIGDKYELLAEKHKLEKQLEEAEATIHGVMYSTSILGAHSTCHSYIAKKEDKEHFKNKVEK